MEDYVFFEMTPEEEFVNSIAVAALNRRQRENRIRAMEYKYMRDHNIPYHAVRVDWDDEETP